jgi:hypothetical protein
MTDQEEPFEDALMGVHQAGRLAREGSEILNDLARPPEIPARPRRPQVTAIFDVPLALHDLHAAGVADLRTGALLQVPRYLAHRPIPFPPMDDQYHSYPMPEMRDGIIHAKGK